MHLAYILSTSMAYSLDVIDTIGTGPYDATDKNSRRREEERLWNETKRQRGVSFPSANKQEYVLIVRLNLKPKARGEIKLVRHGLKRLCGLFERIDAGEEKINIKNDKRRPNKFKANRLQFLRYSGFRYRFF